MLVALAWTLLPSASPAQTLASNNTRARARLNKERSFAASQRKTYIITSWAGAKITELLHQWGNFTRKTEHPDGIVVYSFEKHYSGSGGTYDPGYTVTDQYGNVLEQQASRDNTYAYNFTDFYDFYVDSKSQTIVHVKTGTR